LLGEFSSPTWASQTSDPGTAVALALKELQSPTVEVFNRSPEPLDLVVAEPELVPHQIVEAGLNSELHFGALGTARSLRVEPLGANHQDGGQ
jgi:hypothetical protein